MHYLKLVRSVIARIVQRIVKCGIGRFIVAKLLIAALDLRAQDADRWRAQHAGAALARVLQRKLVLDERACEHFRRAEKRLL